MFKKGFKNFPSLGRGVRGEGFTLAEVLITLAIIGIVAALTIPSVISNYQQQEFKTGLKKAVSVLNEAISLNILQEGISPYETDLNTYLVDYLKKKMSVIKAPEGFSGGNSVFYTADGMKFEVPVVPYTLGQGIVLHESGIKMNDERYHVSWGPGMNRLCGSYGLSKNLNETKYAPCFVLVDVNGDKKPNPLYIANNEGKGIEIDTKNQWPNVNDKKINDIFPILITEEKAIPFGVVAQRAMYSK